jgi:hypothetical protein
MASKATTVGKSMPEPSPVSSYLCQPPRDYRDFLDEQIARLEAECRRIGDQLVLLREERERCADRG